MGLKSSRQISINASISSFKVDTEISDRSEKVSLLVKISYLHCSLLENIRGDLFFFERYELFRLPGSSMNHGVSKSNKKTGLQQID